MRYRTLILRLLLGLCAVACFYGSLWCWGESMPYIMEVSSHPHPSELARFWVKRYAMFSRGFFWTGLSFTMLFLASYLKRPKLP